MASGPVIVGYDGSAAAERALVEAGGLLRPREVLVVVVVREGEAFGRTVAPVLMAGVPLVEVEIRSALQAEEEQVRRAHRLAQEAVGLAGEAGFAAGGLAVADDGPVAATLLRMADRYDAPAVVVGSHRKGPFRSMLVGSTARDLLKQATRPVLVVREEYRGESRYADGSDA